MAVVLSVGSSAAAITAATAVFVHSDVSAVEPDSDWLLAYDALLVECTILLKTFEFVLRVYLLSTAEVPEIRSSIYKKTPPTNS